MVYSWKFDYLKLEDEDLPDKTKVADGSTCLEVDTSKLYVAYKGEWYEQNKQEEPEPEPTPETPVDNGGDE